MPTLLVEAVQEGATLLDVTEPACRFDGAVGGFVVVPPLAAKTWNSESCPAGQPLLAVKVSRTYRVVVLGSVMLTEFPVDGLNVYEVAATIWVNVELSVLP